MGGFEKTFTIFVVLFLNIMGPLRATAAAVCVMPFHLGLVMSTTRIDNG